MDRKHSMHKHTDSAVSEKKSLLISLTFPAAEAPCSTEKLQGNTRRGQINKS